jgi:hypothetical protein
MLADLQAATRQLHEEERARRLADEEVRQAQAAAKAEENRLAALQAEAGVTCPQCDVSNVTGARFCAACGHSLVAAPSICQRGKCKSQGVERRATQVGWV